MFDEQTCETCDSNTERIAGASQSAFVIGVITCGSWCSVRNRKMTSSSWRPASWFKEIQRLRNELANANASSLQSSKALGECVQQRERLRDELDAEKAKLADGVTIEYITQGVNNVKTNAKIGNDRYVAEAIFKKVCDDRDAAIADKERYAKIIDQAKADVARIMDDMSRLQKENIASHAVDFMDDTHEKPPEHDPTHHLE